MTLWRTSRFSKNSSVGYVGWQSHFVVLGQAEARGVLSVHRVLTLLYILLTFSIDIVKGKSHAC